MRANDISWEQQVDTCSNGFSQQQDPSCGLKSAEGNSTFVKLFGKS